MKLSTCFPRIVAIGILLVATSLQAKKLDENQEDESTTGKEVIPNPTNDEFQGIIDDALREIMQEFSSHVTALHDPLFFSRRRFPSLFDGSGGRSFSSWDPFSLAGSAQSVTRWSPRYEVLDDQNSFVIKVDVPGFHFHEMNVELEAGGRVLSISGRKEEDVNEEFGDGKDEESAEETKQSSGDIHKGSRKFSSHTSRSFQQKFTLDPSIDSSKMSANLDPEHGVLVIRAPRKQLEIEDRKLIPITQFDEVEWEELISGESE
jgi:HSP20 family molecular chaperone IbpA